MQWSELFDEEKPIILAQVGNWKVIMIRLRFLSWEEVHSLQYNDCNAAVCRVQCNGMQAAMQQYMDLTRQVKASVNTQMLKICHACQK